MKRMLGAILTLIASFSFGATLSPITLLNPAGSTSGQAIVSTGSASAPGWGSPSIPTNSVALSGLAQIAANVVLGNPSGSTANVGQIGMPSCSASGGTLQWTSGTGFTCVANAFASPPATGYGSTTPEPVAATTISATGLITPTSSIGIKGTATNDNPSAGNIGENSSVTGTAVSLATGTSKTITSQTLSAGQWQVWGACQFLPNSGTTTTGIGAGISTTTNTMPAMPLQSLIQATFAAGPAFQSIPAPQQIFQFSTATTVYLVANANFSGSTETATCTLQWQRPR